MIGYHANLSEKAKSIKFLDKINIKCDTLTKCGCNSKITYIIV